MSSTSERSRRTLCETARERPNDVLAQLEAAYACDAVGLEAEAVVFYDAAWALGVPADRREEFLIGYGSTLKNVGRLDESERVLRQAITEDPLADAARAFLALTLNAAGRPNEAIAELLRLLTSSAHPSPGVARYRRALLGYEAALRRES